MLGKNQKIKKKDLDFIRSLEDFDLIMLLSDIHDHGWPMAHKTLGFIRAAYAVRQN